TSCRGNTGIARSSMARLTSLRSSRPKRHPWVRRATREAISTAFVTACRAAPPVSIRTPAENGGVMSSLTLRTASGYGFPNRLHVFLMPLLGTLFWNKALELPLPLSYYLMIVLTTAAGYIFNIYTDHAEDEVNYQGSYLVLGRHDRWTVPIMLACYAG